jgi:aminopeptidase-like protein
VICSRPWELAVGLLNTLSFTPFRCKPLAWRGGYEHPVFRLVGRCVRQARVSSSRRRHVTVTPALDEPGSVHQMPEGTAANRGNRLYSLVSELYPICRSITGNGVRESLRAIGERIPLAIHEVPSGTRVFDWTIPREWNIRDAYVKNSRGERLIDFRVSNLHVMSYSVPVHETMPLARLAPHLHSRADQPDVVPYRTSYYEEQWGFCLTDRHRQQLEDDEYEVCVDATLADGHLTYGECFLPGDCADEVLVSSHVCHPSLCNDNLSGVSVATFLAAELNSRPHRRLSYRFLFIPGTIGAITWLARNQENARRIKHGLVLTCVGDAGGFHYKKSRRGSALIDRVVPHVLRGRRTPVGVREFSPYGYDERQYCSPGFDLPVGCLMRSVWGEFPQYHTSADNLQFVTPDALGESLQVCLDVLEILESNRVYCRIDPYCEPALGRRGLYEAGSSETARSRNLARLWVLNLSDGSHSLFDIAERANLAFSVVRDVATELAAHALLVPSPEEASA